MRRWPRTIATSGADLVFYGGISAITEAAFATRDFDGALGRWSFDANGDIDLRHGARLIVRDGAFETLTVLPIEA